MVAASLANGPALFAQSILVVDANGSTMFRTIGSAVAAAVHGDVILVRAGTYPGFVVDGKGVSVLCDPGVLLELTPRGRAFASVYGIPAGRKCTISGLDTGGLVAESCAGLVLFENVAVNPFGLTNNFQIRYCQQLVMQGVSLATGSPAPPTIEGSSVVVHSCSFSSGTNKPGLRAVQSKVTLAQTTCVGWNGWPAPLFFPATPGIELVGGSLTITGSGSRIASGQPPTQQVSAIVVSNGGALRLDPAVALQPANGAPAVAGAVPRVQPTSMVTATAGGRLSTTVHAAGALRAHTMVAIPLQPPLPTPFGDLWLGAPSILIDSGPVPASGIRQTSLPLPPLTPGLVVVLQAIVARPNTLELSTPHVLLLR